MLLTETRDGVDGVVGYTKWEVLGEEGGGSSREGGSHERPCTV